MRQIFKLLLVACVLQAATSWAKISYTVQKGDNLTGIIFAHYDNDFCHIYGKGHLLEKIAEENSLDLEVNEISVGTVLTLGEYRQTRGSHTFRCLPQTPGFSNFAASATKPYLAPSPEAQKTEAPSAAPTPPPTAVTIFAPVPESRPAPLPAAPKTPKPPTHKPQSFAISPSSAQLAPLPPLQSRYMRAAAQPPVIARSVPEPCSIHQRPEDHAHTHPYAQGSPAAHTAEASYPIHPPLAPTSSGPSYVLRKSRAIKPVVIDDLPVWHALKVKVGFRYAGYNHVEKAANSKSQILSPLLYEVGLNYSQNFNNTVLSEIYFDYAPEKYDETQQTSTIHNDKESRMKMGLNLYRNFYDYLYAGFGVAYKDVSYLRFHDVSDLYLSTTKRLEYKLLFLKEVYRTPKYGLEVKLDFSFLQSVETAQYTADSGFGYRFEVPLKYYLGTIEDNSFASLSFFYENETQDTNLFQREYSNIGISAAYSFSF